MLGSRFMELHPRVIQHKESCHGLLTCTLAHVMKL